MTVAATKLPFAEQIRYFKHKVNLPTDSYTDIFGEEHDYAFVVAGANRNDIVADFRKAVDKAINDGTTLETFRKDFDSIVSKYGWNYTGGRNWRSRTIYDTNLYSSFQAGRFEQQQSAKELRPYWEYVHLDGQENPRIVHQSWGGLVLHADDPFWSTHYPINAYGCHCTVRAHSRSSLKRRGLSVSPSPKIEYETRAIGIRSGNPSFVNVPVGIDPGFDRIPGKNRADVPSKVLLDKAIAVPPKLASTMVGNVLNKPAIKRLLNAEVAAMVDTVAATRQARGVAKSVGVIPSSVIAELERRKLAPASAIITLRDEDILHSMRDSKADQLPIEFWRNVVSYLIAPEAILLDKTSGRRDLIYVFDLGKGKGKAILKLDYKIKVRDPETNKTNRIIANAIRSGKAFIWSEAMKQGFDQYEVLFGDIK